MPKWYPVAFIFALSIALALTLYLFFSGIQLIVFTWYEWRNSWLMIAGMSAWMFTCIFVLFCGVEYMIGKAKLHLNSA